jgi:hypothetical protein
MPGFKQICLLIFLAGTHAFASDNAGKTHWAFQPLSLPPVPQTESRLDNPIDAFIRVRQTSLKQNPRCDKATLARRIYFDLIGLPPNPAQLKEFTEDSSLQAVPNLIERLLASPQYGERWGR